MRNLVFLAYIHLRIPNTHKIFYKFTFPCIPQAQKLGPNQKLSLPPFT